VLLPYAGLVRGALLMGLANVAVGLVLLRRLSGKDRTFPRWLSVLGVGSALWLVAATAGSTRLTTVLEDQLYQDHIIVAESSRYQRLIITRWHDDVRLYLNGHLQFSSVDEYRYHETLVHPAASLAERRTKALVLGGGDGLVARELLKYDDVEHIDLVDLDPMVTTLFRDREMLAELNGGSLRDRRVVVHNQDAMRYVEGNRDFYDVIIMDLPDPSEPNLGKLYTRGFFSMLGRRLASGGTLAAQCTSPYRSRRAYWSIVRTLEAARWGPPGSESRLFAAPYHTVVPTFGTWGFVVAASRPIDVSTLQISVPTRYLRTAVVPPLFVFPPDMSRVEAPISVLDDPAVVRLYREGYHKYLD
jgi:spermidine synthase